MTKLQFLARTMGARRRQKEPPISRYAAIIGCAAAIEKSGNAGATVREIASACGETAACDIVSQIQRMRDAELLEVVSAVKPQSYRPTPAGLKLIAPLVNLQPVRTAAGRR